MCLVDRVGTRNFFRLPTCYVLCFLWVFTLGVHSQPKTFSSSLMSQPPSLSLYAFVGYDYINSATDKLSDKQTKTFIVQVRL